jgi:hypothetical protein
MGGLRVTVCLPADARDWLTAALDAALAPFEQQQGFAPERDLWDHWRILGGSDASGFWISPGNEDDSRLVHDQGWDGYPCPSLPGMCAGGPRELLDLRRPHVEAEESAGRAWDLWHSLAAEYPPARTLSVFLDLPQNGEELDWVNWTDKTQLPRNLGYERAVAQYLAQPLLQAFIGHDEVSSRMVTLDPRHDYDPVFRLSLEREQYQRFEVVRATRQTDLLTTDGWWIEPDGEPVHGACPSRQECTHTPDLPLRPSASDIAEYLERLPHGVVIVSLRCHV